MAACSCNAIGETCHCTCLCIRFWNYNLLGYLKGANEVNRQYFQQAVLLYYCIMLEYICSSASRIISCPKLCYHDSPRPRTLPSDEDLQRKTFVIERYRYTGQRRSSSVLYVLLRNDHYCTRSVTQDCSFEEIGNIQYGLAPRRLLKLSTCLGENEYQDRCYSKQGHRSSPASRYTKNPLAKACLAKPDSHGYM